MWLWFGKLIAKIYDDKKHIPLYAPFKMCTADRVDLKYLLEREPTIDAVPVVRNYREGDVCIYGFAEENKSCAIVEIVKVLDDDRGVAKVKFLKVICDDTGNGLFNYLQKCGDTMNASFKYMKNITPRMDGDTDG